MLNQLYSQNINKNNPFIEIKENQFKNDLSQAKIFDY